MAWDPEQYERFKAERERPFHGLLNGVPELSFRNVLDLGCGTGELTGLLRDRWPAARVTGVDNSATMLAKARGNAALHRIDFVEADLADWAPPESPDLIFSNAAIHWIPDQDRLMNRLAAMLEPGGVLAVQAPNNRDEIAYRILEDLLDASPWRERLKDAPPQPGIEGPDWYLARLRGLGFSTTLWETTYYHQMPDASAIVEWMKGTTLTPVLSALSNDDADAFLATLNERMARSYPGHSVVFPFRRLFFVSRKPASAAPLPS